MREEFFYFFHVYILYAIQEVVVVVFQAVVFWFGDDAFKPTQKIRRFEFLELPLPDLNKPYHGS